MFNKVKMAKKVVIDTFGIGGGRRIIALIGSVLCGCNKKGNANIKAQNAICRNTT